jgi:hypothetical protein
MHPVKHKKVLEDTPLPEGMDQKTARLIVDFFWKSVHAKLSSGEHHAVKVTGMGTFQLKGQALDRKVLKSAALVDKLKDATSMQAFAIRLDKSGELEKLTALQARLREEHDKKRRIKALRKKKQA